MISPIQLECRLSELRDELAVGDRALRELDARREHVTTTMMRIGGAIQILEELLAPAPVDADVCGDCAGPV